MLLAHRSRSSWLGAALAAAVLLVSPAAAKLCGDDVDGEDVPCACGDVVVSSLVLDGDPVLAAPCADDGLIVRAPGPQRRIVVDLRGQTLRGAGHGVGIRVVDGGQGGAHIVSRSGRGRVAGFEDGIVARGSETLSLVEDLAVEAPRRDGVRVSGDGFVVRRVEVRDAGRDGFSLGGRGFEIADTRAVASRRFGYFVMGDSGTIGVGNAGNVAEHSVEAGFNVMGAGHALANCRARAGGRTGLHLQAVGLAVRGCEARDNAGDGIAGVGSGWHLADNLARGNRGDGIAVRGPRLTDGGGNRGEANGSDRLGRPAVQCEIGGIPCAL